MKTRSVLSSTVSDPTSSSRRLRGRSIWPKPKEALVETASIHDARRSCSTMTVCWSRPVTTYRSTLYRGLREAGFHHEGFSRLADSYRGLPGGSGQSGPSAHGRRKPATGLNFPTWCAGTAPSSGRGARWRPPRLQLPSHPPARRNRRPAMVAVRDLVVAANAELDVDALRLTI